MTCSPLNARSKAERSRLAVSPALKGAAFQRVASITSVAAAPDSVAIRLLYASTRPRVSTLIKGTAAASMSSRSS
eukprot:jgi/Chrpa1/88/Chrysochromulina_OHIO_Genome00003262-RA